MGEVEEASDFKGYWFRISNVLSIFVCGMLCGLENASEIHDWSKAAPVQSFLGNSWGSKQSHAVRSFTTFWAV